MNLGIFAKLVTMKIAVLGAGIAGLTAALELSKQDHEVLVFEKNKLPGGAAGGFKQSGWDWYLDYAYHHLFTNDGDILNLANEIGFDGLIKKRPITASMYRNSKFEVRSPKQIPNSKYSKPSDSEGMPTESEGKQKTNSKFKAQNLFNYLFGEDTEIYKLDSPVDLIKFSRLSLVNRLRAGMVLAALKFGPKVDLYDKITASQFLKTSMGQEAYKVLWHPLFAKKFEDYKEKINMAFFWARVNKRTPALVYPKGGFQNFANKLASYVEKRKVKIHYGIKIEELRQSNSKFEIRNSKFDKVISTLPSPLFLQIEKGVLPQNYRNRLEKIEYLGAQNLILETEKPILDKTYWLNIAASPTSLEKSTPFGLNWMVAVQHTNFMNKKHYGNKHLLYLAKYLKEPMPIKQLDNYGLRTCPPNRRITDYKDNNSKYKIQNRLIKIIQNNFVKYAQPLYTPEFVKNKPDYTTPVKGLYFATMEQTYPYDRGTNFAVRVGKEVAKIIGI